MSLICTPGLPGRLCCSLYSWKLPLLMEHWLLRQPD